MGEVSLNDKRAEAASYTYPHFISSLSFLTCKPQKLSYSSSLFKPFDKWIWFTMFILLIFNLILLKYMKYVNLKHISFMVIIKLIFNQSFNVERQKLTTIIILTSWMLSFIIMKTYYCASLWDSMTFGHYSNSIETIDQLFKALASGDIKIILENTKSSFMDYIKV